MLNIFKRTIEYDELNKKYLKLLDDYTNLEDELMKLQLKYAEMKKVYKSETSYKDAEIDALNQEILMYRKYYKLDEEPSEEIRMAILTDKRVFDLTLENIGLRENR